MSGIARAKYIRMSPRKVKLVLDRISGQTVDEAYKILKVMNKRAALPVRKVLDSAVANAGYMGNTEGVKITRAWVGQGPVMKRLRPRARGRANVYKKPMSHIEIEVR
ncbi:MAG: 50S ribosomal protein L22 [Elusimicrobia bacterium]|nr:50S ribosomal protein L22 [Elusimicrobiota bacterium]